PDSPERGWFSDRIFRKSTSFKKYALDLGISWESNWARKDHIFWKEIPDSIISRLKSAAKEHQNRCQRMRISRKHKYVYLLGKDRRETKRLYHKFLSLNPYKLNSPYPKKRGVSHRELVSKREIQRKIERIQEKPLSGVLKKFYSVKEISSIYGIGMSSLYKHIRTDPNFPCINIGNKKRFLIDLKGFDKWALEKKRAWIIEEQDLPTTEELLGDKAA
ncbi:MAG: hypothetical protein OXB88_06310, partial [Bacteriovoracales bacterium]|nr:hypothetical protein [Bacteriovoracales bacterium]